MPDSGFDSLSNGSGKPRTVRVHVEPVDVELDDDGGLQWTSLASAFPGCSNLYYKATSGADIRTMVRFDGKRFERSPAQWDGTEYYVTLGARSMNYPFGAYENASKQFERSVNAVQAMLGGSMFNPAAAASRRRAVVKPTSAAPKIEETAVKIEKASLQQAAPTSSDDVVSSLQEREALLRSAGRVLSPIEEQFVDLAKISNGKDTIIDSQREELARHKGTIAGLEKDLQRAQGDVARADLRFSAQEEELSLLRRMATDQTYMSDKVADLSRRLADRELELSTARTEWAEKAHELRMETAEAQRKLDVASSQLRDTTSKWQTVEEDLKLRTMEIYEMELELKRLRTLAKKIGADSTEQIEVYTDTMDANAKLRDENATLRGDLGRQRESHVLFEKNALENARLIERNSDLEGRLANLSTELGKINDTWRSSLRSREDDWNIKARIRVLVESAQRSELELEKGELRRQIVELQSMFESATRDVAETTRRLDDVIATRDEMRRNLESAEFKHQDAMARKTRDLLERAQAAEGRVAEMTGLVAALTADANNSQRDVRDMI